MKYLFLGTQGYESYWQSEYQNEDTDVKDEMVTFYQTFSRLGVAQVEESLKTPACRFKTLDVIEAHVYNYADNFQVSSGRFGLYRNGNAIHASVQIPFGVLVLLSTSIFYLQGILVHYRAESKTSDERIELETFVQPIKHYKIIKPVGPINRMKMLQVISLNLPSPYLDNA